MKNKADPSSEGFHLPLTKVTDAQRRTCTSLFLKCRRGKLAGGERLHTAEGNHWCLPPPTSLQSCRGFLVNLEACRQEGGDRKVFKKNKLVPVRGCFCCRLESDVTQGLNRNTFQTLLILMCEPLNQGQTQLHELIQTKRQILSIINEDMF